MLPMTPATLHHRRTRSGSLVVRVSSVALGLVAALGLQIAGAPEPAAADAAGVQPYAICEAEANDAPFAAL